MTPLPVPIISPESLDALRQRFARVSQAIVDAGARAAEQMRPAIEKAAEAFAADQQSTPITSTPRPES